MDAEHASGLILLAIVLAAVFQDFRQTRISNRLILTGLLIALGFRIFDRSWTGLVFYFLNISIPVIILYLIYLGGILGAGDIKLFSVIGGFITTKELLVCIGLSFLCGAMLALGKMLLQKDLFPRLLHGLGYLRELLRGKIQPYVSVGDKEQSRMHFSLAIAMGFVAVKGMSTFF